jgi:hydroxypyruvate reductase
MAAAVDEAWRDVRLSGVVVTPYGTAGEAGRIEVLQASHPVPDEASVNAAGRILDAVANLTTDDLVLALISGGGSSLMVAPAEGLTLQDKKAVNGALLACGATISEINIVRRRLSLIKGGRLAAAAHPARVVSLIISDVPGDAPEDIASGPTVPDPTSGDAIHDIIARYGLRLPTAVTQLLARPAQVLPTHVQHEVRVIASPMLSLRAAASVAQNAGVAALHPRRRY